MMNHDPFSRCHPLINFIFFLGAIICAVIIEHPAYLAAAFICAFLYLLILRGGRAVRLIVSLLPLLLLIALINPLLNTQGVHVLFYLSDHPYTLEALCYGIVTAVMLASTVLWFSCYNQVMTSDKFTSLFGNLSVSLLFVMILRMIPGLSRKTAQITTARKCIGKGTNEHAGIRCKIKSGAHVLSAVTDHALEGSVMTADAMRSRGFGCAKRTSYRLYHMRMADRIVLPTVLILPALVALFGRTGVSYTPHLAVQSVSWGFPIYCVYLLIPVILHITEVIRWRILRSGI